MKRTHLSGIDFFRVFFMIEICFWHIWTPFIMYHLLSVEFFFLISGVFLYESFSRKQISLLTYVKERWKRLYPAFFLGLLVATLINCAISFSDGSFDGFSALGDFIALSSLLFQTGLFHSATMVVNAATPLWFVGAVFVSAILIYACINYNKTLSVSVLFPAFILGFITYTYSNGFSLTELWGFAHFRDYPYILPSLGRALCEMMIGVILAAILEANGHFSSKETILLDFLSLFAFVLLTAYTFIIKADFEAVMLLLMIVLIISLLNPASIWHRLFSATIWRHLAIITYEVLCIHMLARYAVNGLYELFPFSRWIWMVVYIVMAFALAELLHWSAAVLFKGLMPKKTKE